MAKLLVFFGLFLFVALLCSTVQGISGPLGVAIDAADLREAFEAAVALVQP